MIKRIKTSCFVLKATPYKETSLIIDAISDDLGRISFIAKGARSVRSSLKSMLQLFVKLDITVSYPSKNNSLRTLLDCSAKSVSYNFLPPVLFSALYVNELISCLYKVEDESKKLFELYIDLLENLSNGENEEFSLRIFEFNFLKILGYGINIYTDYRTNKRIRPYTWYLYKLNYGFTEIDESLIRTNISINNVYNGSDLIALETGINVTSASLKVAKILCKEALAQLLKNYQLKSRELYKQYISYNRKG
ncbi:MAG: DNA repair protein RecO [Succinivibrionaceae bacterium]